jgi:hypothetical protein
MENGRSVLFVLGVSVVEDDKHAQRDVLGVIRLGMERFDIENRDRFCRQSVIDANRRLAILIIIVLRCAILLYC